MKKKFKNILLLFLIMFFLGTTNVFAKSPDEIPNRTFIIGTHEFTPGFAITTQRLMLAARTIPGGNLQLSDMIIYYKTIDGIWINSALLDGSPIPEAELPDNFTIEFVNTVKIDEPQEPNDDLLAAQATMNLIDALPSPITLDDKTEVIAARDSYDALTAEQKALVTNLDKLTDAEAAIIVLENDLAATNEANQFKTDHATSLALTVETVVIDNKTIVNAALDAYNNLSSAAQAKLSAEHTLLNNLIDKISALEADLAAAQATMNLIDALPSPITLDDKTKVIAARDSYDALTAEQKALVTNLDKLTDAEAAIIVLENDLAATNEANQFKTDHATSLALTVETVVIDNKTIVNAALDAYNNLSSAAQAKLSAEHTLLNNLIDKISALEADLAAAQATMNLIDALPSPITLDDKTKVIAARDSYDALTAEQKALVTNLDKLTDAEAAIVVLEAQSQAKEDIKVSYLFNDLSLELNEVPGITVDENKLLYKVNIKPLFDNLTTAQASGRSVNTMFSINTPGVTVYYYYTATGASPIEMLSATDADGFQTIGMPNHPLSTNNIEQEGTFYIIASIDVETISATIKLVDSEWSDVVYGTQNITAKDELLVARVNASQLRKTEDNKAKEEIGNLLVSEFELVRNGDQLTELVSLFWFDNYHYQNKFTFSSINAIETALNNTIEKYDKIVATFSGVGSSYDSKVQAIETYIASAQRLADTSASDRSVVKEITKLESFYTHGIINSNNKVVEPYATLINDIPTNTSTNSLAKFLAQVENELPTLMAKARAKEDIKVSYSIAEPVIEFTNPGIAVGEDELLYKVVVNTSFNTKAKAQASGRSVNTMFTINTPGVTVYYYYTATGASPIEMLSATDADGFKTIGMPGHPLSANNIDNPGIIYVLMKKNLPNEISVTIKLVDAEWNDITYGEQTITKAKSTYKFTAPESIKLNRTDLANGNFSPDALTAFNIKLDYAQKKDIDYAGNVITKITHNAGVNKLELWGQGTDGQWFEIADYGYWGPPGGVKLDTNYAVNFYALTNTEEYNFTVTIQLVDAQTESVVLASKTITVDVIK